jgi:hypothetical protein
MKLLIPFNTLLLSLDCATGSLFRKLQATSTKNDACDSAISVNASDLLAGTVLEGSTSGATLGSISCESSDRKTDNYKFAANGARYRVTTCHEATENASALWVDKSTCDFWGCTDVQSNVCPDGQLLGATVEFY